MEIYDRYYRSILAVEQELTNNPDSQILRDALLTMCEMFLSIANPIAMNTEDEKMKKALAYLTSEVQEKIGRFNNKKTF